MLNNNSSKVHSRTSRLFGNFVSLAAAEIAAKVLTFSSFAYLARIAGPDNFGYVELAGAAVLCLGLIVEQGFSAFGAREIAKQPLQTGRLVSEIILVRIVLAVGLYIILVMVAIRLNSTAAMTRLLLLYGLSLLALPLMLQWVFQGHDQMRTVATIQIIRQLIFALLVFAFVRDSTRIWLVGAAETIGTAAAAAFGVWAYRRRFGGRLALPRSISPQLLREGVTIGLSQILWVVKMSGATLILALVATAEDVGFFGGSMRVLMALHTFVWLYYFNLLPSLARARASDDGTFARLTALSLHGVAWAAVIGCGIWVSIAPQVVEAIYGNAFAPARAPLQWLAGVCAVSAVSGHYRFGLIAAGEQTTEMITALVGAVSTAFLVPAGYRIAGVSGAAAGLLAVEVLVWLSAWWYARQRLQLRGHTRFLIRPVLAAATISFGLWWLPSLAPGIRTMVFTSALIVLAWLLDATVRDRLRRFVMLTTGTTGHGGLSKATQ